MANIEDTLNEIGNSAVAIARDTLAKQGKNATGKTSASLRYDVVPTDRGFAVRLIGRGSSVFTDKGRGAGKQPPTSAIREWCEARGIPVGAAYPIARAIGERGTLPPPSDFVEITAQALSAGIAKEIKGAVVKKLSEKA